MRQEPRDFQQINDSGIWTRLPGITKVYSRTPIVYGLNFTWGEATKGLTRIPPDLKVVQNIIRVARKLQEVRDFYGKPITITSWYRPPAVNKSVGGVSNSRHLVGDGVDFIVHGVHPLTVYKDINTLWGNFGGLGKSANFTHADGRGKAVRWKYDNSY